MPRVGEKFINAIGREVVAHGGATPRSHPVRPSPTVRVVNSGIIELDVYGREYDTGVPVFLETSDANILIDRLAISANSAKGTAFGSIVTRDSLEAAAAEKGHVFGQNEIGIAPGEWTDVNGLNLPLRREGAPVNVTPPVVSFVKNLVPNGVAVTTEGEWVTSRPYDTLEYQWFMDGAEIAGETTDTYTMLSGDEGGLLSCRVTATNSFGSTEATSSEVLVNPYINSGLIGGAASGPVDGNNAPDAHQIGFNTINSGPLPQGDGTFHWEINPLGEDGRAPLFYDITANHPDLEIGDTIIIRHTVENVSGSTPQMLALAAQNDVDFTYLNRNISVGQKGEVAISVTVTGALPSGILRLGTGNTTNMTNHCIISDPSVEIIRAP